MTTTFTLVAIGLIIIVLVVRSIRVIPAAQAGIVERLGKYQRTIPAGLALVIPIIDRVRVPFVDLGEQVLAGERSLVTGDNHLVSVSTTTYMRVIDPQLATYQVADYRAALDLLVTTTLRNQFGELSLDDVLSSRGQLTRSLLDGLSATAAWGLQVDRVEITDISRPRTGRVE